MHDILCLVCPVMPNLSCHALLELSCLISCPVPVRLLLLRHEFACPVIPRLSCHALPYLSCPFCHASPIRPVLFYLASPVVPYLYCHAFPVLSCLPCSVLSCIAPTVLLYFGCPVMPSPRSVLSCLAPVLSFHA